MVAVKKAPRKPEEYFSILRLRSIRIFSNDSAIAKLKYSKIKDIGRNVLGEQSNIVNCNLIKGERINLLGEHLKILK